MDSSEECLQSNYSIKITTLACLSKNFFWRKPRSELKEQNNNYLLSHRLWVGDSGAKKPIPLQPPIQSSPMIVPITSMR